MGAPGDFSLQEKSKDGSTGKKVKTQLILPVPSPAALLQMEGSLEFAITTNAILFHSL